MTNSAIDHQAIREMLPDYAIGALPDPELDAVGDHVAACAECEAELDGLLELGAVLDLAAGPSPASRDRLMATIAAAASPRSRPAVLTATPITPLPVPAPMWDAPPSPVTAAPHAAPAPTPALPVPTPLRQPRSMVRWLAAVTAVLVLGLGLWNVQLQRELHTLGPAAIIQNAAAVISLDESQLSPRPTGTLFVSAEGDEAVLTAAGLPPVATGESYQIWLFDSAGGRTQLTEFAPDPAGRAQVTLSLPQSLLAFSAIAISAGVPGEATPSGPLALGAWFTPPTP